MTQDFTVTFDAERQRAIYVDKKRQTSASLVYKDGWLLRPETIRWWTGADGIQRPVGDYERELVVRRLVAERRKRAGWWLNVVGQPFEANPSAAVEANPEERFIETGEMPSPPVPEDAQLLEKIEQVLAWLAPMVAQSWDVAQSISRQLCWCRGTLRGEKVEAPPGAFSMGLMATREFDMYGSDAEIAQLINEIQGEMQRRGHPQGQSR